MEPIQEKGSCCLGPPAVQPKDGSCGHLFSSRLEVSSFIDQGSPGHQLHCACSKQQTWRISACHINAWSSLLFLPNECPLWLPCSPTPPTPRRGHFICSKNLSRKILFSPQIFLVLSGSSSAASWLAEAAFPVILTILKPNFFLKLSNHPLLALSSPALAPSPSFGFKLSCDDFIFIYRCGLLTAILHPHKSCIFNMR